MNHATKTRFLLGLSCAYSFLLFLIPNYLLLITNGQAQILTWTAYSQIVQVAVLFLGAGLLFVVFVRWTQMAHRKWFLLQLLPFAAISGWLFGRLGDSVNEYIHYPQYATCVMIWHSAVRRLDLPGAPRIPVLPRLSAVWVLWQFRWVSPLGWEWPRRVTCISLRAAGSTCRISHSI